MSDATLTKSYDTEVRPLIDLIDRLRGFGLDRDINLPAVAVIGDQSAGKSSVLEAISGVQLPRGTGIVTRCPLEMRMKHRKQGEEWVGKIAYTDKDGQEHSCTIQGPEHVGKFVRKAQTEMTGDKLSISDSLITLEVMSPDVPDLTLIDLPGIARNAADGQPADIEVTIKYLIKKYIRRQTTIILAVLQSNIDIATCEAIKMAKEFDEDGCRTLGVLTKPDLVDPGAEHGVMSILENEAFPLSKGYIVVKCRGQRAVEKKQSLKEALAEEVAFFDNHDQFKLLPPSQRGIAHLSVRLTKELKTHIQRLLPQLRDDVHSKLQQTEEKLDALGVCPENRFEKRQIAHKLILDIFDVLNPKITSALLNQMVNHFANVLSRVTRGEHIEDSITPPQVNRLYNEARKSFVLFYKTAQKNTPDTNDISLTNAVDPLNSKLKRELEEGRGRELCDYVGKFEYVEKYAKLYVKKLQQPAMSCFDRVHEMTMKVYEELIKWCFGRFPSFAAKAKEAIKQRKAESQKRGKDEITRYFMMEESFIYTQDNTYMTVLHDEEMQKQEQINPKMSAMNTRLLVQKALSDTTMHDVEKILRSLVSYYKVAMRRICDHVPMLVHQHIFREEVRAICAQLSSMAADDDMLKLIAEEEDVAKKREMYREKQGRLQKAMEELDKFELVESTFDVSSVNKPNFMGTEWL